MNSTPFEALESLTNNKAYSLAYSKLYIARMSNMYSLYQLENARWKMSKDMFDEITQCAEIYQKLPNPKLFNLSVEVIDGEGQLQLWIEI